MDRDDFFDVSPGGIGGDVGADAFASHDPVVVGGGELDDGTVTFVRGVG